MLGRWIVPLAVLPGTVLVLVPGAILWFSRSGVEPASSVARPDSIVFWAAAAHALPGLALAFSPGALFSRHGEGTAAPWDPPRRLVIRGLYRHMRNPMLTGVILLLAAEALFFHSCPLGIWAGAFFLGNAIYFPLVEEPGLRKRFGNDYVLYCRHVRRWIPRLTPWVPPGAGQ